MSWVKICQLNELFPNSGCAALVAGQQVALFYVPQLDPSVYALDNWDPIGESFVLSRGIIGDQQGVPCVASPLYKQHFALEDGRCLDEEGVAVRTWPVELRGEEVWLKAG